MVFVTPPKIYCGEKTRDKTGNSKFGLITYTFRAQIIISQLHNWEQFCYRKISDSIYFQDGPKYIIQFCAGVFKLTSHCNFKTCVNVPHVNKTVTNLWGVYIPIYPRCYAATPLRSIYRYNLKI